MSSGRAVWGRTRPSARGAAAAVGPPPRRTWSAGPARAGLSGPPCARLAPVWRSSAVSAALTSSGFSSSTMCPASGTTTNSASGSRSTISSLCSIGISLSLSPVSTSVGMRAQRLQRAGVVQPGQRRVELRDHVDRGAGDHRVDVVRQGRVDVGRTRTTASGSTAETMSAAIRRVRSANAGPPAHRPGGHREDGGAHTGEQLGQPKFRSSRLPLEVEISATPTTFDPNSSGLQRRQPHDRHAAHRVADEDHRPARHPRLQDGGEVAGELLDRRVLRSCRGRTRRGRAGRRRPAGRRGGARSRWPARRRACAAGRSRRPSTACSRARRRRSAGPRAGRSPRPPAGRRRRPARARSGRPRREAGPSGSSARNSAAVAAGAGGRASSAARTRPAAAPG